MLSCCWKLNFSSHWWCTYYKAISAQHQTGVHSHGRPTVSMKSLHSQWWPLMYAFFSVFTLEKLETQKDRLSFGLYFSWHQMKCARCYIRHLMDFFWPFKKWNLGKLCHFNIQKQLKTLNKYKVNQYHLRASKQNCVCVQGEQSGRRETKEVNTVWVRQGQKNRGEKARVQTSGNVLMM